MKIKLKEKGKVVIWQLSLLKCMDVAMIMYM